MKKLYVLVIGMCLYSCKTVEYNSNSDLEQSHDNQQYEYIVDIESSEKSPLDHNKYIEWGRDTIEISRLRNLYDLYRNEVSYEPIGDFYDKRFKRGLIDNCYVRYKVNKIEDGYDSGDLIYVFSQLAKVGDGEVESWLLKFFDAYITEAIKWNNRYSDGPTGKAVLFLGPLDVGMLQTLNRLPPTIEKVELIMRLYRQETEIDDRQEDVSPIYGDRYVLGLLGGNIEKEYYTTYKELLAPHEEMIISISEEIKRIYRSMKNGAIPLIDRETWKTKSGYFNF